MIRTSNSVTLYMLSCLSRHVSVKQFITLSLFKVLSLYSNLNDDEIHLLVRGGLRNLRIFEKQRTKESSLFKVFVAEKANKLCNSVALKCRLA